MSAILDTDFGRSRASVTGAESQNTELTTAQNNRRDFGHTLTQTSGNGRQPKPAGFAAFIDRFDGLRIPSSPLHDF